MLQLVLVARSAVLSGVGVMQHFHVGIKLAEEPHRFSVLKLNGYGLNLEKVCKGSGRAACLTEGVTFQQDNTNTRAEQ